MPKNENKENNVTINNQINKNKNKMGLLTVVILIIVISIGGFFGYKQKLKMDELKKELIVLDLKEYPIDEKEASNIYSRDIAKQAYLLKNGAISFEGTMVFYNKLCANLYSGLTGREDQLKTEPDLTADSLFGDKLSKDALNRYLQTATKSELVSTEKLAEGAKKAINEQFKATFGYEIVKDILVTYHVVQ